MENNFIVPKIRTLDVESVNISFNGVTDLVDKSKHEKLDIGDLEYELNKGNELDNNFYSFTEIKDMIDDFHCILEALQADVPGEFQEVDYPLYQFILNKYKNNEK